MARVLERRLVGRVEAGMCVAVRRVGGLGFYNGGMSTADLPDDAAAGPPAAERLVTVGERAVETLGARFGSRRRVLSFAAVGSVDVERGGAFSEVLLSEGGFGAVAK